jgi:hypothetical protein
MSIIETSGIDCITVADIEHMSVKDLRDCLRSLENKGLLSHNNIVLHDKSVGRWIADSKSSALRLVLADSLECQVEDKNRKKNLRAYVLKLDSTPDTEYEDNEEEVKTEEVEVKVESKRITLEALGILASPVQAYIDEQVSEVLKTNANLDAKINEAIAKSQSAVKIEVRLPNCEPIQFETAHKAMQTLCKIALCRKPDGTHLSFWLVGGAGTGKSHIAYQISQLQAKANGWDKPRFFPYSTGRETSRFDLLGFISANGTYIKGIVREPYEFGGLLLLDEIDSANANVLTSLNSALSNGHCSFPDAVVRQDMHFLTMATANTWGGGYNDDYVGRNKADQATLDRFVMVLIDHDEALEMAISPNKDFTRYCQKVRDCLATLKIKHMVTSRRMVQGGCLLACGISKKETAKIVLWRDLATESRKKVEASVGIYE